MMELTPSELQENADVANSSVLPERTKGIYMAAYDHFVAWKNNINAMSFSEDVFLSYFHELAHKYMPSTLWSKYSMLKATVKTELDLDIKDYSKLNAFLKRQSKGFRSKKAKILTANDINRFIKEAPDDRYLATKVALIFGITGGCRPEELANITLRDIETHGEMLLIKVQNTKNKTTRSFSVHGRFYKIVKKYENQRTPKCNSDRFFQNYQKGKCTAQVIGYNKLGQMPKQIAKFLELPDADSYTGHSFKRTSTAFANFGADITSITEELHVLGK